MFRPFLYVQGFILCLLLIACFLSGCSPRQSNGLRTADDKRESADLIRNVLQMEINKQLSNDTTARTFKSYPLSDHFYRTYSYQPIWFNDSLEPVRVSLLINMLGNAALQGLDSNFYDTKALRKQLHSILNSQDSARFTAIAGLELHCTDAFLRYCNHLQNGYMNSDSTLYRWEPDSNRLAYLDALAAIGEGHSPEVVATSFEPDQLPYRLLSAAYEQFLSRVSGELMVEVPDWRTDSIASVTAARKVLAQLAYGDSNTLRHDSIYRASLQAFQRDHSLKPDGIVGKRTAAALMIPVEERIRKAILCLEKWRWEENWPAHYVFINIPSYELLIVSADSIVARHRIIVGRKSQQTPELSSAISYFITFPFWHVPTSIVRDELLPKIASDSGYISRNAYEILDRDSRPVDPQQIDWTAVEPAGFNYLIRQRGGNHNAMGLIKFMFPNPYQVYLHDTNDRSLFDKEERTFSHGCIRMENPFEFARFLITYDSAEIAFDTLLQLISAQKRKRFDLKHPLPVYVRYFTSTGTGAHLATFKDVYGRDTLFLQPF